MYSKGELRSKIRSEISEILCDSQTLEYAVDAVLVEFIDLIEGELSAVSGGMEINCIGDLENLDSAKSELDSILKGLY